VTAAGERTREAIHATPVAGLVYFNENLKEAGQIREMLANTQEYSLERTGLPMLLALDEEGGPVRRINGRGITPDEEIPPMCEVQDPAYAYEIGCKIGAYLSDLGFNVDFAPVADVLTNPDNTVVRERSFGSDPDQVATLVASVVKGLRENGIAATLKHFPGHGSTSEDSHAEYACSYQTEEELFRSDLVPFLAGIREGAELIMAGHISLPNVTGDLIPASLNRLVLTSILREKMHYDGIVITDALNMGAITEHYDSADAAVMAVQAGCDLLLMPADFHAARSGIRSAVENGVISEERIDESVRRVITLRLGM
jgi:beta-N-acetylhexosaminidase